MYWRGIRMLLFLGLYSEDELAGICVFWYLAQQFLSSFPRILEINGCFKQEKK
jgi:hypothetical protein